MRLPGHTGDNTVYDPDPITGKGDEHGTHVAGTIAATGNDGQGITRVSWDAQVASLKFLGPNDGLTSDAGEAINYAVHKGMPISNNSWGGEFYGQALRDAITRADTAGHLFVAAAGNGGDDLAGDNNDATEHYPSNYPNSNIVSVAATDDTDQLASFSNFGPMAVDLAAPGVGILSTLPGSRYGQLSGTSMAAPHVAGVAALLKSQNSPYSHEEMRERILQFAEKRSSLQNKVATGGRLNANASLVQRVAPDTTRSVITSLRPVPGSRTRDRTPSIGATVRDERSELAKGNIRLYLDGRAKGAFSYNTVQDRLSYTSSRLSYKRHTVRIVATDAAGNAAVASWKFTVRR
jgi:subtilisin family serine protease